MANNTAARINARHQTNSMSPARGEHNDDKETVGENKTPARQEQDDVA